MTNNRKQMRSLSSWLIEDEDLDFGDLGDTPVVFLAPATLDEDWPDPDSFELPPHGAPRRVRTFTDGLEKSRRLHRLLARVRD